MFGLLKKKTPYVDESFAVYGRIMAQVAEPSFYESMGVPDSFDGRFDMLNVHAFMVMEALREKDEARAAQFNQALFDQIFSHMHVTLREIGVGDVGIPKHQQKMMKAFNGRILNYTQSFASDDFEEALMRNLYGTVEAPLKKDVKAFAKYARKVMKAFEKLSFDELLDKKDVFKV